MPVIIKLGFEGRRRSGRKNCIRVLPLLAEIYRNFLEGELICFFHTNSKQIRQFLYSIVLAFSFFLGGGAMVSFGGS